MFNPCAVHSCAVAVSQICVCSPPLHCTLQDYWKLADDATMRDLLLNVRADEACHSHVNHTFGSLQPDADNPFAVGNHTVPQYHKQAVETGQPVPTYGKEG